MTQRPRRPGGLPRWALMRTEKFPGDVRTQLEIAQKQKTVSSCEEWAGACESGMRRKIILSLASALVQK